MDHWCRGFLEDNSYNLFCGFENFIIVIIIVVVVVVVIVVVVIIIIIIIILRVLNTVLENYF